MENNNPKVSIIMPSLNEKDFIEESVKSVINQTLKDIEIICVDSGSTDGTLEILQKYSNADSRIKIINSDRKSYGYQMNLGISQANGEYIGIVETDDFIDERMYEILYNQTDNSSADISKANFFHFYDYGDFKKDNTKKNTPKHEFSIKDNANFLNGHPSIWAGIYKKDFLNENNIRFMEIEGGGWVDNPFLFQTTILAKKIMYTHDAFYYYRELNPNSSTNDLKDLSLPMKRMLDVFKILEEYSCFDENILKAFYVRIFWHINDILERDNYHTQKDEIFRYTHEVIKKIDKEILKKYFGLKEQKLYYKYLSPIDLISLDEEEIYFKKSEIENIVSEHDFLCDYISKIEAENSKLRSENKKIKVKNKKLKKQKKLITDSKSYKLGNFLTKPYRIIKKTIKE